MCGQRCSPPSSSRTMPWKFSARFGLLERRDLRRVRVLTQNGPIRMPSLIALTPPRPGGHDGAISAAPRAGARRYRSTDLSPETVSPAARPGSANTGQRPGTVRLRSRSRCGCARDATAHPQGRPAPGQNSARSGGEPRRGASPGRWSSLRPASHWPATPGTGCAVAAPLSGRRPRKPARPRARNREPSKARPALITYRGPGSLDLSRAPPFDPP